MSRRQTLGPVSPSALNRGGNGNNAQAVTQATRVQVKDVNAARMSMAPNENRGSLLGPGAMDPRRSSAFGRPAGPKQDPRPLNDKNFLNDCIRTVISYLSTHGFPAAVSPKTLASPTAKDFAIIVQFLMQKFDCNMKMVGKIEDEVTSFLKRLNYPFQLSKSALFAVGSPHSWPAVLAALTWMVELLNYNEKAEEGSNGMTSSLDTEDGGNKKQFYEFMSSSYRHFLAGDDPKCEELEAEMLASYKMKEDAIIAQQAKTAAANAEVLAEIQRIKSQPSPLVAAQQKLAEHNSDAEKFQKLIENLQQLKQSLQRKLVERQEEVKAKQDRMARVQAENEALRVRVATQPMNKADLNRMIMERTRQKEVLEAITGQCEEMERKVHQQEVQVVAEGRALDASASRYNQLAHRLKLIPASAKRADGITFELRINRVMEASTPSDLSNLDLKGVIRPALERLGEQYRIKAVQLSHDLLSLKQQVASGKEAIAERAEENKSLELQILHKESMLKAIREAQEGKVREEADRAEVLKREVDRLRNSASLQQQEMEARKRAATSDLEALQRSCEADLQRIKGDLRTALEMMVQHRLSIQKRIEGVLLVAKQAHNDVQMAAVV